MGDRFYEQQAGSSRATTKPKRKLKADWVEDISFELGVSLPDLSKTNLDTLEKLYEAIIDIKVKV
jgi:hypothetical protein